MIRELRSRSVTHSVISVTISQMSTAFALGLALTVVGTASCGPAMETDSPSTASKSDDQSASPPSENASYDKADIYGEAIRRSKGLRSTGSPGKGVFKTSNNPQSPISNPQSPTESTLNPRTSIFHPQRRLESEHSTIGD